MDKVKETNKEFACRNASVPYLSSELKFPRNIVLKALFDPDMKWRLVEEIGPDCYEVQKDGRLLLIKDYADIDNLTMGMLTFVDNVEVIESEEVRVRLK
jgi:hypothetical protein